VISQFAFLGAVTRFTASEAAPVGKDVTNYMVDGTKDAIRDMAAAIGEGIVAGTTQANAGATVKCSKCGDSNEAGAKFCHACGNSLATTKRCEKCGDMNDIIARFCDNCGAPAS